MWLKKPGRPHSEPKWKLDLVLDLLSSNRFNINISAEDTFLKCLFLSSGNRSSMRISLLAAGPEQLILKYKRNYSFNQTIIPIEKDCISFIAHLLRPESVIMETITGGSSNGYSTKIMAFRISKRENPIQIPK